MLTWFAYSSSLLRFRLLAISVRDEDGMEVSWFTSIVTCTTHDSV